MNADSKFVFVNYISRSGSTLLCSILDHFQQFEVGIEAGFPGFPLKIIPTIDNPIRNANQLDKYLAQAYHDNRFKSWGVPRTALKNTLLSLDRPIHFGDILRACFYHYFNGKMPEYIIHKAGYFIKDIETTRRLFPGSFHLYILRDPRAVFASQKSAVSVYNQQTMASSLLRFCRDYRVRYEIAVACEPEKDIMLIKYEDLVSRSNSTIKEILSFLGANNEEKKISNYNSKIPEAQKHLHPNLLKPPNTQSIEKWRSTLDRNEVYVIEFMLRDIMSDLGYPKYNNSLVQPFQILKSLSTVASSFIKEKTRRP